MQSLGTTRTAREIAPDEFRGRDVYDATGDKIGTVDGTYVDGGTRYLTVRTGWLGMKRHVVPVDDVQIDPGSNVIILPYGRSQLQRAPVEK